MKPGQLRRKPMKRKTRMLAGGFEKIRKRQRTVWKSDGVRLPMKHKSKKQQLREKDQFGPHASHIRRMPCALCNAPPRSSAHHTKHRKHLGLAKHLVPLCGSGDTGCHGIMHGHGKVRVLSATVNERMQTKERLSKLAAKLWAESPVRHLYCAACDRYKGRKPCTRCVGDL
jgi:hypothetical protein